MKQFDLQEYLKNSDRRIVTRGGHSVRILCTDRKPDGHPVVALVQDEEHWESTHEFTAQGKPSSGDSSDDLFFVPEKKTGWINFSRIAQGNAGEITYTGAVYPTKEEAIAGYSGVGLLDTIKIEWEE